MSTFLLFYQISLVMGLGAALGLLAYSVTNLDRPGVTSIVVFLTGITIWIFSDIFQTQIPARNLVVPGMFLRFLGVEIVIIGILLLGLEYTGREHILTRKLVALLALKPVITLTLIVSPFRSLLFETKTSTISPWGYEVVVTPLYIGHFVYGWLLVAIGLGMLLIMAARASSAYRQQMATISLAIMFPFLLNVLFNSGLVRFDLTAPGLSVTALVLAYATLRMELIETMPVARRAVLQEMEDLVLVLDGDGTIARANGVVRDTFGRGVTGENIESVLGPNAPSDPDAGDESVDLTVDVDGQERHFSVSKSVLTDFQGNLLAQVLVCRDTTALNEREAELRRREEQLELLKDVQSNFLQQNLRDELNIVLSHARQLADGDPANDRFFQEIMATSDRLLEWENKARTIENLIEQEDTIEYDTGELRELVESMERTYPDATFAVDLEAVDIVTVPQIDRAIENVLENAVEYNTAEEPRVRLESTVDEETVTLEISDNGPGIETHEIEAITSGAETQLKHGSGFGLWLVYWVIERSGGELSFETDDGTTIRMTFDRPAATKEAPTP
jgi:signal transduction histidine kinase